jgi:hypothetical protein
MRGCVCCVLAAAVLAMWSSVGRADERAEALKIVDAAIQAAGGEAKVAKLQAMTLKAKGAFHAPNEEGTLSAQATSQGIDRLRLDLEATGKDNTLKLLVIVNGDKGWIKNGDRQEEAPAEVLAIIKAELLALRLTQHLTLLKNKDLTLSPLGEVKIDNRAAVGLKVARKDSPDVDIYFDKETHLPRKCELRAKEPGGQEVTSIWNFSAYKEMAGVKLPAKVVLNHDGRDLLEIDIGEVKLEDKLEEQTFAKP